MAKTNKYLSFPIIGAAMILVAQVWFWPVLGDFILSTNINIALALILFSFLFIKRDYKTGQLIVFLLFILVVFKIVKLDIIFDNDNLTRTSVSANVGGFSFDPLIALLIIIYSIVNRNIIMGFFKESGIEMKVRTDKKILFYYDMFKAQNEAELAYIFENYNKYPFEAQMALDKIAEEKNIR